VGAVHGTGPGPLLGAFAACTGYFLGTTLYVKTMIRERDNPRYRYWSIAYHAGLLVLALWLNLAYAMLAAWLLVRAALLPGRRLAPKHVGLVEILNCVLLLGVVALT
ncbi:MAG TPA: hypothetical protein VF163_06550, partial [Micromonosporaceae bacterium]